MNGNIFQGLTAACAIAIAACADAAEAVRWFDGTWDDSGAPRGKLLSDNSGWWGERVWTGVTYSYEAEPTDPRDIAGGNAKLPGRRLLDGDEADGWNRPVGMKGRRPLVAVFDFKRLCTFSEIDLVSRKSPSASASLSASCDGEAWTPFAETVCSNTITRIRPPEPGRGRYLRVSYLAKSGSTTWLDEVLAWGDGETGAEYPEDVRPAVCAWTFPQSIRGNAKTRYSAEEFAKFEAASGRGVEIVELGCFPDEISKPVIGFTPEKFSLRMARNETEARYFAIVNATRVAVETPVSVSGFGDGVSAELLAGGVIRTSQNRRKLSEQEIFDLKIKGEVPEEMFDARYDVLPFFGPESRPSEAILARHVANREQIRAFPEAVPIRPGEAFVVMLRLTSENAAPGLRKGVVAAGKTEMPVEATVVDLALPDPPVWIYAWGPFTPQYPFESKTRFERDVKSVTDLGVTQFRGMPRRGTKLELARKMRPQSLFMAPVDDGALFHQIYNKSVQKLDDSHRKHLDESAARVLAACRELDLPPDRMVLDMPDEIGPGNSAVAGETALYVKSKHPEFSIFCNPCFWLSRGFAGAALMEEKLSPWYNDAIDISVPYRSHLEDEAKRESLFLRPRRVNAQYAHPAARAGRSIAWSSFRHGMQGYAWWCYYWKTWAPGGTPWDIGTWNIYAYETKMALPLENGAAVAPQYENMREAWEDWRLLTALKESGKTELLDALLKEFSESFSRRDMETSRPYKCDFLKLRERALSAFDVK